MIEPLDLAHHGALPRLPERLHPPDVGPVAPPRAQEHRAVVHRDRVPPPLDRLEEELLGLGLPPGPLVSLASPPPDLTTLDARQLSV